MLRVMTSQRASVTTHWATAKTNASSKPPISTVMSELTGPENRFFRSHAMGPMAVGGGGSVALLMASYRSNTWMRRL